MNTTILKLMRDILSSYSNIFKQFYTSDDYKTVIIINLN